jgi:hypothetical protein
MRRYFWTIVYWNLRWGPFVAFALLPVEIVLVAFAGDVQIFGPNPWRLPIRDALGPVLGEPAASHVAGALTDFKKATLYFCLGCQLLFTGWLIATDGEVRARRRPDLGNVPRLADLTPSMVRAAVRWRGSLSWIAGIVVIGVALFGLAYQYVWPSTVGHVFGPVGKGLLSSRHPALSAGGRWPLVLYRAWYLVPTFSLMLTAGVTFPAYLRLTFRSKPPREIDPDSPAVLGAAIKAMGVPIVAVTALSFLRALTVWSGIGELEGSPATTAAVALSVMVAWLFFAFVRFAQVDASSRDPFLWLGTLLYRLRALVGLLVVLGGGSVLFSVFSKAGSPIGSPESVLPTFEAVVLERAAEFFRWNSAEVRYLAEIADKEVGDIPIPAEPADRASFNRALGLGDGWGLSDRRIQTYLRGQIIVRVLFLRLAREDPRFVAVSPHGSTEEWALTAPLAILDSALANAGAPRITKRPLILNYDRTWLDAYRLRSAYDLTQKLLTLHVELLPPTPSFQGPGAFRDRIREIVLRLAAQRPLNFGVDESRALEPRPRPLR